MSDYLAINKNTWNTKVQSHLQSDFYNVAAFVNGKNSLNSIELALLGDIADKHILHLQCHFGQDSLSLQRMGAQVTGVDFSEAAIKAANELNDQLLLNAKFICSDLYSLPQNHEDKYDIIFTSYGTIGWLPDLDKWAKLIRHYLRPSGRFIMADFHPVVWMFDNNFEKIQYTYFKSDPIIEDEEGSYADKDAQIKTQSITWNHGLSEIFVALKKAGLIVEEFQEYDYSPYDCFNGTESFEEGKYRIKALGNKIPMVYSLKAKVDSCDIS